VHLRTCSALSAGSVAVLTSGFVLTGGLAHDVIAECSAEAGYFEDSFKKLRKDIQHAKNTNERPRWPWASAE